MQHYIPCIEPKRKHELIFKEFKRHHARKISTARRYHVILRLAVLLVWLQISLPFAPIQPLAWGLGFDSDPQVIDDADEDDVFSPNEDGVQDKLLISFVTDGARGDFRIIIDVHGGGGIGPPDGEFDPDDDWVIIGEIGSGATENDAPKVIRHEWDGKDRSPEQEGPPTARTVRDGTYTIRVDIDGFQDGRVDGIFGRRETETVTATVDTTSPRVTLQISRREFSPNDDGIKDSTEFNYSLPERLAGDAGALQLEFTEPNRPAISLPIRSVGDHPYNWEGNDGSNIPLSDGTYNLQLRGVDSGGNIGTFEIGAVTIDTEPPSISQVTPGANTYQNTPISVVEVMVNSGGGSAIDLTPTGTKITLENESGDPIAGRFSSDENRLALTLNTPLDDIEENGGYTVAAEVLDLAGNGVQETVNFTFDTSPPIVTRLTANGADLKPGTTINTPVRFVQAFLADNIALNRNASTISLNGPSGAVDGGQGPVGENGIQFWLSFPLETDGSDDGSYTLTVVPVDRAANEGSQRQISFIYDTQPPRLLSLSPIEISEPRTFRNTALSQITAAFDDGNGSGINLDSTTIEMVRQFDESDAAAVTGVLVPNVNDNTLAFRLNQPLQVRDGSQDGDYRVRVSYSDKVGNAQTTDGILIYDTQAPALISTTPADNETVSSLSQVTVRLDDATSGIDFSSTTVRLLHGENEVSVDTSDNGRDTVTLTLAKPLATDGLDDGEYTIEITPADHAGNIGTVRHNRFFFETGIPEIRLHTPSETHISALTTIEAQLLGYIGPGIDFSTVPQDGVLRRRSTIQVIGPDGGVVLPQEITADAENARLMWTIDTPLPRDGSADGEYTVRVRYVDLADTAISEDFTVTFDTQIPTVASTTPGAGDFVSQLNQVVVKFESDLSGVDLGASEVRLIQPNGTAILSNISDDGFDTITLQFNALRTDGTEDGNYTIEVTSADRAGNTAGAPLRYEFTYATQTPEIRLNFPSDTHISTLSTIEAQLLGYTGPGINFSPVPQDGDLSRRSTIQVIGPEGQVVPAKEIMTDAESARLMWAIDTMLPRNGSADGEYTVSVRYEDLAGSAFADEFTLIFDTQIPTVANTTPSAGDYISELSRVLVKFEPDVSGVNLGASEVRLIRPDGTPILSNTSNDGLDTVTLQFNPLRTDGAADGIYAIEVTSADGAGNVSEAPFRFEFTFATQSPEIDTLSPVNNAIVNSVEDITATLIDNSGSGIDFSQSTIILKNADGERIAGVLRNDGALTLTLETGLPTDGAADGEYTIELNLVNELGATANYTRRFLYDSQPPSITPESRMPEDSATNRNRIEVVFEVVDPAPRTAREGVDGSGVDFSASEVQLLAPDNTPIDGEKTYDGISRITFRSAAFSSVGIYTLVVTLVDAAGNSGIPQTFTITYDMEKPVIEALNAISPSRAVPMDITGGASNISDLLTRIEAVLSDDSAGIDFDRTSLQLMNPDGGAVSGELNHDGSETVWRLLDAPLPRNGDADGAYSIRVQAFDKAGNVEDTSFILRYDTQAPTVRSIHAARIDGVGIDVLQESTVITSPIERLTVIFSDDDGSGMDLSRTAVRLTAPNGDEVGGNQTDDGATTVFFSFNPLRADGLSDGRYRIQVTPTDMAGNTFTSPIEFPFFYSTQNPEIVSTTPAAFSTVTQFTSVTATLLDNSGEGIDFNQSTIQLTDPNGNTLSGRIRAAEAASTLTLELDNPLPRNGEADGEYIIGLTVADKAGNRVEASSTFIYDTQIPQILSVTANTEPPSQIQADQLQIIDRSLSEITVRFSDAHDEITSVSGVDFAGTAVRLIAPDETQVGVHALDDGVDTMTVTFTRLNRSGNYTLEIIPHDLAGNVSGRAIPYNFRIELALPRVEAVAIGGHSAPVEFVNALDTITASLVDASGIGLDLTSDGSSITVAGPDGEVDGIQSTSGTNEIVWTPLQLAVDGTMDGTYTVTITPVDSAGVSGVPARHQFILDTQPPAVSAVSPINLTEPISYIGEQISQIAALVTDVGPAGLKIDEQRIHLLDSHENLIPGDLTNDGTELIIFTLSQSLATDGSDDGTYTVVLVLGDNAGNLSGIAHQAVYDTVAPTVQTNPADGEAIRDDIRTISADLQDTGGSGIDFDASTLTLLDANGEEIAGEPNHDGRGRMTLRIPELVADGNYTIRVLAVDRAGNGADAPFTARFLYSSSIPAVVSTIPATSPPERATTNRPLRQVEAQLQFDGGDSDRSTITLLSPDGTPVAGIQTEAGSKLVYRLSRPLATDGSDDGMYTISVIPVNRAGRQGATRQFTFNYDTIPPEADPDTVSLIVAEPGVNNALNEIQVLITDDEPSSGINWDNLAESWLTLENIETGQRVRGTLSSNEQHTLSFRLATPLASDGSQDGAYRVTVVAADRAKNVSEPIMYEFTYDTRPPLVITHSLEINDLPLLYDREHPDYPSATNSITGVVIRARLEDVTRDGGHGLGVDLSQSTITLHDPEGNPITGRMRQNGVDAIEFKSDALTVEGLYQVTITSVGLDEENLGFQPRDSISTQFLYERTEPVAALTDFGGVTTLENEPIPLEGTAHDPETDDVSASGVLQIEIIGVGPDGAPINPVPAQDESEAEEVPWSRWSADFLPTQSGVYNLDIRATDHAGNVSVADGVTATFSVSLSFKGSTYVWPNPVRHSLGDAANFSFDINAPVDDRMDVLLSIYDFAGDLVYYEEYQEISAGRTDQLVTWNLENQSGADVARGVYIFRLEAQRNGAEERANVVGKILVVE